MEKLGILGGGQLARMLCEAAYRLGLTPLVLAQAAEDPAARLCPGAIFGSARDPRALRQLFSQVDAVIFENEFVTCPTLQAAAESHPVRFLPGLRALEFLQDKSRQKALLLRLGIPTSPFRVYDGSTERLGAWVREEFSGAAAPVFKWAQLGYDGKGTWLGRAESEALAFCQEALKKGAGVYREDRVAFRRELAIVAVRSTRGEFATYPLVVSEQESGICRRISGPAVGLGVPAALERQAQAAARKIAEELDLVGCFALEFFETPDGQLWVNELAPRVHNSGHYTQDAARTSQFENHLRAVLGLSLGDTRCEGGFAMLNLLGPAQVAAKWREGSAGMPMPQPRSGQHLHWYGKMGIRPGRKLGHLNAVATDARELGSALGALEAVEAAWREELDQTGALV